MYIILRCQENCSDEVLNIIYGENQLIATDWIRHCLLSELDSLSLCPALPDTKSVSYQIVEGGQDSFKLVRHFKKIHRGYVYNSSEKLSDTVCIIKYIKFNENNTLTLDSSITPLWNDINNEINTRVIQCCDHHSLRQVFNTILHKVGSKKNWTNTEYTSLVSDTLNTFHKELYSSIAKKMKRFGKQH